MSISLFLWLFTVGSMAASLLTQALKKALDMSSNLVALINALIVGAAGTTAAYILMGVPLNLQNIICIILMSLCIWIGSMIGYDKVIQTISQLRR